MRDIHTLHNALKAAGLPIDGISIGTPSDRATWSVQWTTPPTKNQEQRAAQVIAAFVPSGQVEQAAPITPEAVLAWCATKLNVDPLTATLEVVSGMSLIDTK